MARSSHAQPDSQRAAAVRSGMSSGPVDVVVQHGSGTVNRRMGGHGRRLTQHLDPVGAFPYHTREHFDCDVIVCSASRPPPEALHTLSWPSRIDPQAAAAAAE